MISGVNATHSLYIDFKVINLLECISQRGSNDSIVHNIDFKGGTFISLGRLWLGIFTQWKRRWDIAFGNSMLFCLISLRKFVWSYVSFPIYTVGILSVSLKMCRGIVLKYMFKQDLILSIQFFFIFALFIMFPNLYCITAETKFCASLPTFSKFYHVYDSPKLFRLYQPFSEYNLFALPKYRCIPGPSRKRTQSTKKKKKNREKKKEKKRK